MTRKLLAVLKNKGGHTKILTFKLFRIVSTVFVLHTEFPLMFAYVSVNFGTYSKFHLKNIKK